MIFTKDSRTVKSMLIMMELNGQTIKDVETFIPNQSNLQEVVKECLKEQEAALRD